MITTNGENDNNYDNTIAMMSMRSRREE